MDDLSLALASIGWGTLSIGALTHLAHPHRLRRLLARHTDHDGAAAVALLTLQVALSLAYAIGALSGATSFIRLGAAGVCLMALGFIAWVGRLLTTGSQLPCACSFSAAPTSRWSLVRASVPLLALAAMFGDPAAPVAAERLTALVAGLALGGALFVVPEALAWPEASRGHLARIDVRGPDRTRMSR